MSAERLREAYLHLLRASVRNTPYRSPPRRPTQDAVARAAKHLETMEEELGAIVRRTGLDAEQVAWTHQLNSVDAHTLGTDAHLDLTRRCIETVLAERIPGDLLEAGAYRGGHCVWMRGVLTAHDVTDRTVWVADSFQGLPQPDPATDPDDAVAHALLKGIGSFDVDLLSVRATFARYGLTEGVRFLPGWFADTLPDAPIDQLALLRLDGDWFSSTREALEAMAPRVVPGGFVIIDDYGLPLGCRRAVDAYRETHGITDEIVWLDHQVVYWRSTGPPAG